MRDAAHALDIDLALAERARDEGWRDAFDHDGQPDFFTTVVKLLMGQR